ncbi:hypothetical protein FG386_000980 [Cryptosporidium ryanae]|uniref:uncharacterized protein n=1 Tax=Cryptosporidium ryanae TaxID=515981 RepID=UPI00351A864E|nr:hypothetical protein FG386_000980 [Cryptosporidium ryanae]
MIEIGDQTDNSIKIESLSVENITENEAVLSELKSEFLDRTATLDEAEYCTLCGIESKDEFAEKRNFKFNSKIICYECLLKLQNETNSMLQEELEVKNQINTNLKMGLEEQLQIISKCKCFITTLEEMISLQDLWISICDVKNSEGIQGLIYESHAGIQRWNEKNRQLEIENSNLKSQINHQMSNISLLETHIRSLQDDYNHSKDIIDTYKRVKIESENFKNIASESTSLMEKFKLENDGLRVRCFKLEQRVKELTNNYGYEKYSFKSSNTRDNPYKLNYFSLRTLSIGIQNEYNHSMIMENSNEIFNNHQLLNCVESFIYYLKGLFCW